MIFLESLLVALSTYSRVVVPQFNWNERNMKYAICFLPFVGILCGGALFVWFALSKFLGISSFFFAAISACIPVFLTGGIHIDGYMDTVDALSSHQTRERKLEILKDPHLGAFSVIYCVVYFVITIALLYELYNKSSVLVLCPIFVLSRALSVLCNVNMPSARENGMLHSFTQKAEKKKVNISMVFVLALSVAAAIVISPASGGVSVLFGIISALWYLRLAHKEFGGVTGDTAGFFLQMCELLAMIGAWIGALI